MRRRGSWLPKAVHRYRWLLRLVHPHYRESVVAELCQIFEDEYSDVYRTGSVIRVAALWLRVVLDMAVSLPGAWRSSGWRVKTGGKRMGSWIRDFRIAARSLWRRPGYVLAVALTLSLGIGATTTTYSVVDGVMLRPLPYADPATLVAIGAVTPQEEWLDQEAGLQDLGRMSMPNFQDFRERSQLLENLATIEPATSLLADVGDGPEMVPAARVSPQLLDLLGASPALGRTFLPEEHSVASEAVALISFGTWQRRYGGDPAVLGRLLERVARPTSVVGVLPRNWHPPEAFFPSGEAPEFWFPLQSDHRRYNRRDMARLLVLGRTRRGISLKEARNESKRVAADIAAEFPEGNLQPDGSHFGIGVNALHAQTVGNSDRALGIFLGAAGLLLLLTAMNAAILLLARSLERTREFGVRMALGAGRSRLVRLLMCEAGILSAVGGVLGVLLTYAGVGAFLTYAPSSIPRLSTVTVDERVLIVAALVTLGTGIATALWPALRLTRRGPWEQLQQGGYSSAEPTSGFRDLLVGGQIAVAVVLLSGAGLLFASFMRIQAADPGFEPDGLITMNVNIEGFARAAPDRFTSVWGAWDIALAELGSVPGVESIAGTTNVPFQPPSWAPRLLLAGDTPETWREGVFGYAVTPGFFETMGTRLLEGRGIQRLDGPEGDRIAVVNETFVRSQLEGAKPIGLVFQRMEGEEEIPTRIVGIVEDVVQARTEDKGRSAIYVPYTQYRGGFQAVVRSVRPASAIIPELRRAAARFNPLVPLQDLLPMSDRMAVRRTTPRFQAMLISGFALLAMLLAAAGLYGSLAHSVNRRQREIGVRMALGAHRTGVLRLVLAQGMRVSLAGLVLGVIAALVFARVLADLLYEVEPNDPATLVMVAAVLLLVSGAACLAPALRASGVDPVTVLKAE